MKFLSGSVLLITLVLFSVSSVVYSAEMMKKNKFEIIKLVKEEKRGATRSVVRGAQTSSSSQANKSLWTKLSVVYVNKLEWADEIQMKFYVLCFNKNGESRREAKSVKDLYTMLTGNVKFVNVPFSKDNRGEMFIHPNSIARFGEIKEIRVEIWHMGVMQAVMNQSYNSKKDQGAFQNWWTQFSPKEGLLINRFYTPFAFDGDNSFEEIKID